MELNHNRIEINNTTDLLAFIKRNDITSKQATKVVCKALKIICLYELSKEQLIKNTERVIDIWINNDYKEKPIFLDFPTIDFDITQVYNSEKTA